MKRTHLILIALALFMPLSLFAAKVPDIDVHGNTLAIVDGDTTPQVADYTDFGDVTISSGSNNIFVISEPSAQANLAISSVTTSGTHAADFVISSWPVSVTKASSADMVVTFTPSTSGVRTATITINNDDGTGIIENPYTFVVQGTGTVAIPTVWDGDSASNNYWNTSENWAGGEVPGLGGTAIFTGTAASITQPDIHGVNQTGIALDFQTSGWTISDTVTGGVIRVDQFLFINSRGSGVNRILADIGSFGGGAVDLNIDSNSTLRISGGFALGILDFNSSLGTLVFDGPSVMGGIAPKNITTPLTILANGTWQIYGGTVSAGTLGGVGAFQGYEYQTTTLNGNAVLAPGGNGTFGSEIGTLTWKSSSGSIRTHLVLNSGASFAAQIGDSNGLNDKLVFDSYGAGQVTINSGVTLDLYGGTIQDGEYTIIENLDVGMEDITGTFSTVNFNDVSINPTNFTVNYSADAITVSVTGMVPSLEVTMATGPGGTTIPAPGIHDYTNGTLLTLDVVPASHHYFVQWVGDVSGTVAPTNVVVETNMSVEAVFGEYITGDGTPHWWLAENGLATTDVAAAEDDDEDGRLNGEEYIAGTQPTNSEDVLELSVFYLGSNLVLEAQTYEGDSGHIISNRFYWFETSININEDNAWTNITAEVQGNNSVITNTEPDAAPNTYYRCGVRVE